MFDKEVYIKRRESLKNQIKSGVLLFLGNEESAMNYQANTYSFRQDSTFLYYWGLETTGLAALIDVEEDVDLLFGYDYTMDDIVWMGPQPKLINQAESVGVKQSRDIDQLQEYIKAISDKGRKIHHLPQYRGENVLKMGKLLEVEPASINQNVSEEFIKAVVAQRSVKSKEEIVEIESAMDIAYEMQTFAMRKTKPGIYEREIAGGMEGIASSMGAGISFPIIFSIDGQTLHNHSHDNLMKEGDIAVNDSGAESLLHYASDITRTIPVSGKFTDQQKEIYQVVLDAQQEAIHSIQPGIKYKEIHLKAAKVIANGLKEFGFLQGSVNDIVEQGVHTLFFPHGLGHMMGLDVHDMENLGENYVGYDETVQRSDQFGLAYLRMAKELKPGYVLTVEPGIYFIPELIDMWKGEGKFVDFINYDKVESYKNFGGIRIEDDVLVTKNGHRVLGKKIPKTIEEVEEICSS
jgi:Xaa-Pro dipeptidase